MPSHTFTGTPEECDAHFEACCRSYHPAGYGTRITSISDVPLTPDEQESVRLLTRIVRESLALGGAQAKRRRIENLEIIERALAKRQTIIVYRTGSCD